MRLLQYIIIGIAAITTSVSAQTKATNLSKEALGPMGGF